MELTEQGPGGMANRRDGAGIITAGSSLPPRDPRARGAGRPPQEMAP